MILEQLKKSDPGTTMALLAKAALIGDGAEGVDEGLDDARQLLKAIRHELGLSEEADLGNSRRLVDNFLVKAINTVVIGESNRDSLLANAGHFGRLPPSLYRIERPDALKLFYQLGAKPNHIEDAVKHADDVQHLLSDNASIESKEAISIFLKEVVSRRPNDSFWLLVQTFRNSNTQIVQSVWRVYPNDVDLSGVSDPI